MATILKFIKQGLSTLWDTGATLANNVRKAANLDNASGGEDESLFADFLLTVSYDTTAPSAGDIVGRLWLLPSDDEGTPVYPTGGDGTVGGDFNPQGDLLVGEFEARDPGLDVSTEVLVIAGVQLYQGKQRVVFQNVSGQTISEEWQLDVKTYRLQSV